MNAIVAGMPATLPVACSPAAAPARRAARALARALLWCLVGGLASVATAGEIRPYTQAQFDQLARQGKPVLLAVHAGWCPTCRAQRPVVDALMAEPAYRDVTTLVIDFDTGKPLLPRFKVAVQSTLIAFHGGREVGRSVGDTTRAGIEALVRKTEE